MPSPDIESGGIVGNRCRWLVADACFLYPRIVYQSQVAL